MEKIGSLVVWTGAILSGAGGLFITGISGERIAFAAGILFITFMAINRKKYLVKK